MNIKNQIKIVSRIIFLKMHVMLNSIARIIELDVESPNAKLNYFGWKGEMIL